MTEDRVIRLRTSDLSEEESEIVVPIHIALQSQLVRQLHGDFGDSSLILAHSSCTRAIVSKLFSRMWTPEDDLSCIDSILDKRNSTYVSEAENMLEAVLYLDMEGPLRHLAALPLLLHSVSAKGRTDALNALIESKADIDSRNDNGQTALSFTKDRSCLTLLLKAKIAKLESSGYSEKMVTAILEMILGICSSLDLSSADLDARSPDCLTALHIASREGHCDVVTWLVTARASINARASEKNAKTPLHMAAANGHSSIVTILAAAGADLNASTENGWTPLHYALFNEGKVEVVKALIAARADLDCEATIYHSMWLEEHNVTPLHIALKKGQSDCAQALIAAGCNVNAAKNGECGDDVTPLHVVAGSGDAATVTALLSARADPNAAADMEGCETGPLYNCSAVTPLHLVAAGASPRGGAAVVRALAAARADVSARILARVISIRDLEPNHPAERTPSDTALDLAAQVFSDDLSKLLDSLERLQGAARQGAAGGPPGLSDLALSSSEYWAAAVESRLETVAALLAAVVGRASSWTV